MSKKKYTMTFLIFLLAVPSVYSEETVPEKDKGEFILSNQVSSDFVDRGRSLYDSYFVRKNESYRSFKSVPILKSEITYLTPLEGLSFSLAGRFAMTDREDIDSDKRFQLQPGGEDKLVSSGIVSANGIAPDSADRLTQIYRDADTALKSQGMSAYYGSYGYKGGVPGYYKEANGLKRSDEVNFIIDYSTKSKPGNVSFGIVHHSFTGIENKGGTNFNTEFYGKYSLSMLPDLKFGLTSSIQNSNYYWNITYDKTVSLSEYFALNFTLGGGYTQKQNNQGVQDITGGINIKIDDFFLGFNAAYRPTMSLIESDDPNTDLPLWLQGESTAADGLVADPARTYGIPNTIMVQMINQRLGGTSEYGPYTYTSRTALPETLYWINVRYTAHI